MSMFEVSSYVLMVTYIFAQTLYTLCFFIDFYLFSLPVNFVDMKEAKNLKKDEDTFVPEQLNELGEEGWEAVGLSLKYGDLMAWPVVLLKRPIR